MTALLTAAALRGQFHGIHRLLTESCPARCAVMLVCEDVIVNGVLGAGVPLALSTWRNRTGLSELPPLFASAGRRDWTERVRIDPVALRCYSRAVALATDAYLTRQTDRLSARVLYAVVQKLVN